MSSTVPRDSNVVLKLRLSEKAGTRRLPIRRLWDEKEEAFSFARLAKVAVEYTFPDKPSQDDFLGFYDVTVTYEDEDGDTITISSNEELDDAVSQFMEMHPPVLRLAASVKERPQEENKHEKKELCLADLLSTVSTTNEDDGAKENEKIAEVLAKHIINMVTPTEATMESASEETFDAQFIHGRHTCDSCGATPIIGFRYHAANLPDFDLCQSCRDSFTDPEIVFERQELDCDRRFQKAWQRREKRRSGLASRRCGRGGRGRGPNHFKKFDCGVGDCELPARPNEKVGDAKQDEAPTNKDGDDLPKAPNPSNKEMKNDDNEEIPIANATIVEPEYQMVDDTPTNKQEIAIPEALLLKWGSALEKLHELGFLDDHRNVEALEHFPTKTDAPEEAILLEALNYLINGEN